MSTEARYAEGRSVLPQPRPAAAIEWAYSEGRSGAVGADEYVAGGTFSPWWAAKRNANMIGGGLR